MRDIITDKGVMSVSFPPPLVSVIMNCHNGATYLPQAIDSVMTQTYPYWEIVFFDNASTDESAAIARSYGDRIRYFHGEKLIPLGAARNAALAEAKGDLIAFLDTDDYWVPQKLEWQVATLQENDSVGFVYSNFYYLYAESGIKRIGYHQQQPSGNVFPDFLRYYPVNMQTVLIRGSVLNQLDELFDPTLEVSEEYDVFIRLLYSTEASYMAKPTAMYRVHAKMASVTKYDRYPMENEYILAKLRRKMPRLNRVFPDEVRYLEAKIGYWYAVSYMAHNDRFRAREALRPYRRVAVEFFVLFLVTYLPSVVWRFLLATKTALGAR